MYIGGGSKQMKDFITALDPNYQLDKYHIKNNVAVFYISSKMSEVKCPYCGTLSSKVHSSYEREIQECLSFTELFMNAFHKIDDSIEYLLQSSNNSEIDKYILLLHSKDLIYALNKSSLSDLSFIDYIISIHSFPNFSAYKAQTCANKSSLSQFLNSPSTIPNTFLYTYFLISSV